MGTGKLVGPDVERTTFENLAQMLLDDYKMNARKSIRRATSSVKNLRKFFGFHRALEITSDRITAYVQWRQEGNPRPAKPATIQNELAALKRMFTLGVQAGKVYQRPHIPSLKVQNVRTGFFTEAEFHAVLRHLPEDVRPVVQFAYLTGWRIGEILSMCWSQVDLAAGQVRLEPGSTKNGQGRVFPFDVYPELASVMYRQRERTTAAERNTGTIIRWVFHRGEKPIRDFRSAWRTACEKADVQGRLVHDLRRTAVRNLERAGVSRSVSMLLTGHLTESIFRRYCIASESDLAEGVKKLAALQHNDPGRTNRVIPIRPQKRA